MTSQADGVLIFVSNIGLATQTVSSLALPSTGTCANQCVTQADDTTFSDGGSHQTLLFADKATNIVYALTAPFGFNNAFAAYQDVNLKGFIGALDQTTGNLTPVVSGLGNPGGEAFIDVPEPAGLTLLAMGVAGLVGSRRRRG